MRNFVFCTYNQTDSSLIKGAFSNIPIFCSDNISSERCKSYYNELLTKANGLHTCPNGFASYKHEDVIFTCLRVVGYSDERAKKKLDPREKTYAFRQIEITEYVNNIQDDLEEYSKLKRESEFLGGLLHDYRKYNHMKLKISETLAKKVTYNPSRTIKYKELKKYVYGYQALSNISKARIDTYENLHSDEKESIYENEPVQLNVFKTFDKLRHCGKLINKKEATINLDAVGNIPDLMLRREIDTAFYLIIDNALKYTEANHSIDVNINVNVRYIEISIESIGPKNSPKELEFIFERGFRGANAKNVEKEGQGIGLYTTKMICDRNDIQIEAKSFGETLIYRESEYCKFQIRLLIPNVHI